MWPSGRHLNRLSLDVFANDPFHPLGRAVFKVVRFPAHGAEVLERSVLDPGHRNGRPLEPAEIGDE